MVGQIIGAGLGLAGALAGRAQEKKRLERQQGFLDEQSGMIRDFYSQGPELQTATQAELQFRNRLNEDPVADAERREAQRQQATNIAALTAGGARALIGGLSGATRAAADTMANIEAGADTRAKAGLRSVMQLESARDRANLATKRAFEREKFGAELGLTQAQQQLKEQQAAFKGSLLPDLLNTGASLAPAIGGLIQQRQAANAAAAGDVADLLGQVTPRATAAGFNTEPAIQALGLDPGATTTPGVGTTNPGVAAATGGGYGGLDFNFTPSGFYNAATGQYQSIFKKGGKITGNFKTGGEFDHNTNEKIVIDKEDLAKAVGTKAMRRVMKMVTAALTGGEYVLNKDQAREVAEDSKKFRALKKKMDRDAKV
jgi:hypothetical protein